MRKLMILCDLDSVVANLTDPWLAAYNKDYDDDLSLEKVTEWDTHLFTKPECGEEMYSYLTSELFANLKPLPGAVEAINELSERHFVHFVTAAPRGCADAKIQWVKDYFPHLGRKTATIKDKWMLRGDVLIDDCDANLVAYKEHWPNATTISIRCPYNCKPEAIGSIDFVAKDCYDTAHAWWQILNYITSME